MGEAARDWVHEKQAHIIAYLANRDSTVVPDHIQRQIDDIRQARIAGDFRPSNTNHALLVASAKTALEKMIPATAKRRQYELRLADMIQHHVLPRYGDMDKTLEQLPRKLRECHDYGLVGLCPNGDVKHHWPAKCHQSKLCAHEARTESMRLSDRYLEPLARYLTDNPRAKLYYGVISPKNCALGDLHAYKRALFKAFSALNRRDVTKNMTGAVVVEEDPLGRGDQCWNVHLNVLAVVEGHFDYGEYRRQFAAAINHPDVDIEWIDEKKMRKKTERSMRRRAAQAGEPMRAPGRMEVIQFAFLELVKYTTKIAGSDHDETRTPGTKLVPGVAGTDPDGRLDARPMDQWEGATWYEWYRANRGFRRTRSYGVLYRVCDRCGHYGHTEGKCTEEPEPEPVTEWIGDMKWQPDRGSYELSIGLVPADKSTLLPFDSYEQNHERGPP